MKSCSMAGSRFSIKRERWLAVADLHFGYELSQRAAGRLVPMWGMASISERLTRLVDEYRPRRLIILGDLVHDKTAARGSGRASARISAARCEPLWSREITIGSCAGKVEMVESWETERFYFHHGHCAAERRHRIQIIGHHHPAGGDHGWRGAALEMPGFRSASRVAGSCRRFLPGRAAPAGRGDEREPDLALHGGARLAAPGARSAA